MAKLQDPALRKSFKRYSPPGKNPFSTFFFGFAAPFRALALMIRRPVLLRMSVKPLVLNLILFILAFLLGFHFVDDLAALFWERPESGFWLAFWWVFLALFAVAFFVFVFVAMLLLAGVVAAPFIEALSREVERDWLGPLKNAPLTWRQFLPQLPSLVGMALSRLIKLVFLTLPLLLLGMVPLIGPILMIVGEFTITGIFLAFNFMAIPMERRDFKRKHKAKFLKAAFPAFLGLGIVLSLMMMVPLIGLLMIPVATLGGTLVFMAMEASDRVPLRAPELGGQNET